MERSVTATPSEAYAGPVYSSPVIHTTTREISFLFPNLSAALSSRPLTPVALQKEGALEVSGSARIGHEDFPDLLNAIRDSNWPSVVRNEHCQAAYDGGGEGYSGPVCTPSAGNQTTIVLDLKLFRTASEPSAETLSADSASR